MKCLSCKQSARSDELIDLNRYVTTLFVQSLCVPFAAITPAVMQLPHQSKCVQISGLSRLCGFLGNLSALINTDEYELVQYGGRASSE